MINDQKIITKKELSQLWGLVSRLTHGILDIAEEGDNFQLECKRVNLSRHDSPGLLNSIIHSISTDREAILRILSNIDIAEALKTTPEEAEQIEKDFQARCLVQLSVIESAFDFTGPKIYTFAQGYRVMALADGSDTWEEVPVSELVEDPKKAKFLTLDSKSFRLLSAGFRFPGTAEIGKPVWEIHPPEQIVQIREAS